MIKPTKKEIQKTEAFLAKTKQFTFKEFCVLTAFHGSENSRQEHFANFGLGKYEVRNPLVQKMIARGYLTSNKEVIEEMVKAGYFEKLPKKMLEITNIGMAMSFDPNCKNPKPLVLADMK